MRRLLLGAVLLACALVVTPRVANAYSKKNHALSVTEGARKCAAEHAVTIDQAELDAIVDGVHEPDELGRGTLQMVKQRFEPGHDRQRNVLPMRIAAQSIHGSPNPTRPQYTESPADREWKSRATRVPETELLPNRLDLEIYSYDTNKEVRNRMLVNASQFLCVSFAHRDDAQSARKFGNFLHMIGDTYSASHVQRSEPEGSADNCGTEKIEWHFSMDLVSWKLHAAADKEHEDWRFGCLVEHTADLMKLWTEGRAVVREQADPAARLAKANENVGPIIRLLCERVFREDPEVLRRPAGGAAAGYSIASGTDRWKLFKEQTEDRPIQPVGLTAAEEARAFYREIQLLLEEKGGPAHFWYPSREMGDLCDGLDRAAAMPAALQCTEQEIEWATSGSVQVESMWIPARPR